MEWIDFKKYPPPCEGGYLVFPKSCIRNGTNFPSTAHFEDGRFYFNQNDVTHKVAFWSILPHPPKIEKLTYG